MFCCNLDVALLGALALAPRREVLSEGLLVPLPDLVPVAVVSMSRSPSRSIFIADERPRFAMPPRDPPRAPPRDAVVSRVFRLDLAFAPARGPVGGAMAGIADDCVECGCASVATLVVAKIVAQLDIGHEVGKSVGR